MKRRRLRLEDRLVLDVVLASLPAIVVALVFTWTGSLGWNARWTITVVVLAACVTCAAVARSRVTRPLQTLAGMISALREGDYSIRGRTDRNDDALGETMTEVNALAQSLRAHDVGTAEANALLAKVTDETDVAMFAFDAASVVQMANRAAAALVGKSREALVGRTAAALGLADLLEVGAPATIALCDRTWELRRTPFREAGRAHTLVVLSDVSRALREEERQAWQRLVRVLSHEINNSLTPISSIAGSLRRSLARDPARWADEAKRGLDIIERRAEVLARFMTAYAELARLPRPELAPVDVATVLHQAAQLERRVPIRVVAGPAATVLADADQLEQLLINIFANAADAALDTAGGVELSWTVAANTLRIEIRDEGRGIADTANLFVPFFTTKPGGSGIGLALSRQIAEAHGGALTLDNRTDRTGCIAALVLPVLTRSNSGLGVPQLGSTSGVPERSLAHDTGPLRAKGEVTP